MADPGAKLAYYPGCSLHASSREYALSTEALFARCGLLLNEIQDWSCCGASPAHAVSEELAVALPLRNMAIAEASGFTGVFTPCAACYSRLRFTAHALDGNKALQKRMVEVVGKPYGNSLKIHHLVDVLSGEIGVERIKSLATRNLSGLKAASYYGCLLVRPPGVAAVDAKIEAPTALDELVAAVGATPIDWPHKTECCGAGLTLPQTDSVLRLSHRILKAAKDAGADCVVVACPLCHANLDMRQAQAEQKYHRDLKLPVIFISQFLGLAMGIDAKTLGLDRHLVNTDALFSGQANGQTTR